MPEVRVYSRPGCHLCELLIADLMPLLRGRARLALREVDDDPAWRECYGERIPVVEIGGDVICELRLDRAAVLEALAAADEAARGGA